MGGRIDGVVGGRLVEIKNRRNRLFERVRTYERVQLECYMRLLRVRECTLVQHLRVAPAMVEERRDDVHADDAFWEGRVLPGLRTFCAAMDAFLGDTDAQDAFFNADEEGKAALVEKWVADVAA